MGRKGLHKEDYVLPELRRPKKRDLRLYFIFQSMEWGHTFRISVTEYATQDPNRPILASAKPFQI